ncbi:hypothetical protein [Cytophaga aurantiaca]|uniref:hypothetical protein n=1 Tax=Cytophaga aurantiaca TaxID=29530 RepID=UPI00037ECC9A|nr:hypothetical protein [Cytophaga aurantiaca]
MKKIIIAVSLLAATFVANAQEPVVATVPVAPTAKMYKPVAGNVLAELGLFGATGFVNLPTSTFGTPQIKVRYFLQDQIALRVGFNLSQNVSTNRFYEAGGSGKGFAKDVSALFGLNAGIEKHFSGTGRLSTYVGADASYQRISAATKWENTADGTTFSDGDTRKTRGFNDAGVNASSGFGLRAFAGADYYFVEKVYLGAEFGWGFTAMRDTKTKEETTVGGVSTTVETKSGGGVYTLAPSLTAGVRIGFIF